MRKNTRSKKPSFQFRPMCAAVLFALSINASANPNGGSVINGNASFNAVGNTLTVTNTPGAIINWQGFSINSNEITHFAQQSASSTVLNRVITSNPSVILGTLSSNGRVFLVNPGGIVFGAGSTVDVAGMVATSLNLSDADFLAGRGNFTLTPGAQAVSNAGNITAQSGGEIYLIAPKVENSGVITAPNGEILLAAGHEVQLVNTLDPNLRVNITAPAGDATNVGQLVASAGRLGLFGTVVKNTGSVSANGATLQGGKIVFRASQRVELGGTVSANGSSGGSVNIAASHSTDMGAPGSVVHTGSIHARGTTGAGGAVNLSGDSILSSAGISTDGATAGGQISVQASNRAISTTSAHYSANSNQGQGGDILVAATVSNYTSGSYSATGLTGGNLTLAGDEIKLAGTQLDASGTNGGGNIHIGGLMHGALGFSAQGVSLANSANVLSNSSTSIKADALQNGAGGEVVLWSDQVCDLQATSVQKVVCKVVTAAMPKSPV
ncbi:MAG: filamentous hemagglutinin N-terminal domain-containing protein [Sideroxydans sp.]|nr:filamentous hemagglutinin N-terminal domain-containing protein [Sideroxydans sp.]